MEGMPANWREKEFLSAKDIAEIMDVSKPQAYEFMKEQKYVMFGKNIRLRTVHLEKYIKDQERSR